MGFINQALKLEGPSQSQKHHKSITMATMDHYNQLIAPKHCYHMKS